MNNATKYFEQLPLLTSTISFAEGNLSRGLDGHIYYTTKNYNTHLSAAPLAVSIFRRDHLGTSLKRRATIAATKQGWL